MPELIASAWPKGPRALENGRPGIILLAEGAPTVGEIALLRALSPAKAAVQACSTCCQWGLDQPGHHDHSGAVDLLPARP